MTGLTLDAMREMMASLPPRQPQCVAIFTWHLAPVENALQFSAPEGAQAAEAMLGPYARDVIVALERAQAGDFVWVLHPSAPDRIERVPWPGPVTAFMGIPVRELVRDPAWGWRCVGAGCERIAAPGEILCADCRDKAWLDDAPIRGDSVLRVRRPWVGP